MDLKEELASKNGIKNSKKAKQLKRVLPIEKGDTNSKRYACLGIKCKVFLDSWREARNHMDKCGLMNGEKYKARLKESADKALHLLDIPFKKKRENSKIPDLGTDLSNESSKKNL